MLRSFQELVSAASQSVHFDALDDLEVFPLVLVAFQELVELVRQLQRLDGVVVVATFRHRPSDDQPTQVFQRRNTFLNKEKTTH